MGCDGLCGFHLTPLSLLAKCRFPRHAILSIYIIWIGFIVNQNERLLRIGRRPSWLGARGCASAFFGETSSRPEAGWVDTEPEIAASRIRSTAFSGIFGVCENLSHVNTVRQVSAWQTLPRPCHDATNQISGCPDRPPISVPPRLSDCWTGCESG